MAKTTLKQFLKEASLLSAELHDCPQPSSQSSMQGAGEEVSFSAATRLRSLVSQASESSLQMALPNKNRLDRLHSDIFYSSIFENAMMHLCLFGFRIKNTEIPLHNHPDMHGFVKVLRGKVSVESYSWLDEDEEESVIRTLKMAKVGGKLAKCNGSVICSPGDECMYLGPRYGNVHCITAVEDGSTFLDVLVPGYGDRLCTYYRAKPFGLQQTPTYAVLKEIPVPVSYGCQDINFSSMCSASDFREF